MASLTSIPGIQPQQAPGQPLIPPTFFPNLAHLDATWLTPPPLGPGPDSSDRKSKRHSRRDRGKTSKKHKKQRSRRQLIAAYFLQLIGLICLVLAAVKAFEPLTGVGFTLVIMGYRAGVGKGRKGVDGLDLGGKMGL